MNKNSPKITKEEVIKLAQISQIKIDEHDIIKLTNEIDEILNYASFLADIAKKHITNSDKKIEFSSQQNINILREDVVIKTDAQEILAVAPEVQEDYFVVPSILKQ